MSENTVNIPVGHVGLPPRPGAKPGKAHPKKTHIKTDLRNPGPPADGSPGKAVRRASREKIVKGREAKQLSNNDLDDPLGRTNNSIFNIPPSDQASYMRSSAASASGVRPATPQRIQADASAERVAKIAADLDKVLPMPAVPSNRPSTASSRQNARVQGAVGSIVPPRPPEYVAARNSADKSNNKRYQTFDSNSVLKASMKEDPLLRVLGAAKEADANALLVAAEKGDNKAVANSLKLGVDPNECSGMDMYTPLHHAANRGHIAVIRQLLEAGADVNKKNKAAEAALHLAAYNGNLTVVEMLLDKEAIIDCLNEDGDTPLFFGSRKNHPAVVRLLMQRGADATVTNRYGDVAVDEARQKRTQEAFAAEKLGDEGQAILGHDLVLRMFGFLSAKELSRSACVCGRWHRVAEHDSLWKKLGVRRWELSLNASLGLAPTAMAGFLRPKSGSRSALDRRNPHSRPASRSGLSSAGSAGSGTGSNSGSRSNSRPNSREMREMALPSKRPSSRGGLVFS